MTCFIYTHIHAYACVYLHVGRYTYTDISSYEFLTRKMRDGGRKRMGKGSEKENKKRKLSGIYIQYTEMFTMLISRL